MSPLARRSSYTRGRYASRSRTRSYEWTGVGAGDAGVVQGTISAIEIVPNSFIATMSEPTLMRIYGEAIVWQAASAAGDMSIVSLGIELIPDSVPIGNVESPFNDINSNRWLWHKQCPFYTETAAAPHSNPDGLTMVSRFIVDAKSKRRVSEADKLVLSVSQQQLTGSPQGAYFLVLRFLFAEK